MEILSFLHPYIVRILNYCLCSVKNKMSLAECYQKDALIDYIHVEWKPEAVTPQRIKHIIQHQTTYIYQVF